MSTEDNFLKAMKAGMVVQRIARKTPDAQGVAGQPLPSDSAVSAQPAVQAPEQTGVMRRVGRRGLAVLRPLARPFLYRFEWRVRTAVEKTSIAERMARLEDITSRLETSMARLKAAADRAAMKAAQTAEGTNRLETSMARLEAAADRAAMKAARTAEETNRLETSMARLEAAVEGIGAKLVGHTESLLQRHVIPLGDVSAMRTPDGYLLVPTEDVALVIALSEGGVMEPGTRRVLAALLPPGAVFLDVGAHVGTMTLLGARLVGDAGRVYAVEPTPRLAALLRRNMVLNGLEHRVILEVCGASDVAGEGMLHQGMTAGHNSLLALPDDQAGSAPPLAIPLRKLDAVVPPGTRVDVAKIDVEGAELRAWRGMSRVLAENPDIAAVLEFGPSHLARGGVSPEEWFATLQGPGFDAFAIDELSGRCRPTGPEDLANVVSVNVLLLRPGAAARHPGLDIQ
jgi:FkbM family methyltransferase